MSEAFPISWEEVTGAMAARFTPAYRLCGNPRRQRPGTGGPPARPQRPSRLPTGVVRRLALADHPQCVSRRAPSTPATPDRGLIRRRSPGSVFRSRAGRGLSSIRFDEDIQKALLDLPFDFREAVVVMTSSVSATKKSRPPSEPRSAPSGAGSIAAGAFSRSDCRDAPPP